MNLNPWPSFSEDELQIVNDILVSGKINYWTGEHGKLFETEFSKFVGVKYSICVANGSLALSLAYLALDLNKNDEIITTPRTFIATASSAVLLGYKPIFADIDHNSGLITAETIKPLITKKTKAICVVHLAGWPADMLSICKLAKEYGLYVIEDCSQAHGAGIKINGKFQSVGSFGDISTWSFCQDKIISTGGEGGMVSTNSRDFWEKMWSFKDHGKSYELIHNNIKKDGYKWVHKNFGSNFRLTEIQSAIGRIQLRKIKDTHKKRLENAKILIDNLKDIKLIRIPLPKENYVHAWYKFYCFFNEKYFSESWSRDRVIKEINLEGYPAFHGGCSEIYMEECFTSSNLKVQKRLSNSQNHQETSLMLLIHNTIHKNQMINYAKKIREILIRASNN